MLRVLLFINLFFIFNYSWCQADTTYAERLGFPKGKKIVILHVDDAGMSFDSNEGVIEALTRGVATSTSVMMPCSWVPGIVHFLKQHQTLDAGLHLTLTSEWNDYRWGPLSGKDKVPGLTDQEGDLWPSVQEVVAHASADEVEMEMRAQLDRALKMGFVPTHLDTHMGTVFANAAFLERYLKIGMEKKIPVMLPGGHNTIIKAETASSDAVIQQMRGLGKMLWNAGLPVLDDLHNDSYNWKLPLNAKKDSATIQKLKTDYYIRELQSLKPGITMVIMHCTHITEDFKYISDSGIVREGDLLSMMDSRLRSYIMHEGIILTTWRELMERRKKIDNK